MLMASKTSQPVYISNKTLDAIDAWLKTANGKKLGIQDKKKAVGYILTKFLEDQT
jgi:hypothetical protein